MNIFDKTADFIVRHDPKTESNNDLAKKIIVALFGRPLKYNKPVKVGVFGDSGEGKSSSYLTIASVLLEAQGISIKDYLHIINAYTPLQYMEKLDELLHKKEYKLVNIFGVHEARTLVSSKDWQSFTTQAVGHVNAMSRSIKPICFFIISQFFGDITKDVRKTFTYIVQCQRPLGQSTKIYIYKTWHDERDLESIKVRKRRIRGKIVLPNGRRINFVPTYLSLRLPDYSVLKEFDYQDTLAKKHLLKNTMEKYIQAMKSKFDVENAKVEGAVEFYTNNPDFLSRIGKMSRGKFKLRDEVRIMHDFTSQEVENFGVLINERIKNKRLGGDIDSTTEVEL
jgi:hypothetical protein